ncbi:unnamed protein product [Phytophthora fragariaefolia]|uniref:Unnamed protein product n=1 Tax=Phytophthora fragariaefolia TaxID=1490495 RepID=A0A9W6XNJ2_9STRA|nr:unnamed protein product [Phytophthora fragariaefolia]
MILDRAHLVPGKEKSSKELGMGLAERTKFLLTLLMEHTPPLDEQTIGDACKLCRVATGDGQYLWIHKDEFEKLEDYIKCEQDPYQPIKPTTISLRIADASGSWDAKILTKMYCK